MTSFSLTLQILDGAVCQDIKTGGPWTASEGLLHINHLEMLAALKAFECFTTSSFSTSIGLRVDNTSAVSYINRLGGRKSAALCPVALNIASWCESKNLELHAIFLPGVSNVSDAVTETTVIRRLDAIGGCL